jgi:hypothetical protein
MKIKHKLLWSTLFIGSTLMADVTTLLPYAANIQYDSEVTKSLKDKGTIAGLYFSHGNLDYLFELDYAKTDISYKNSATSNLVQDDITIAYSRFTENYFMKFGLHHINTTDTDLGNGNTYMLSLGEFSWDGYDKSSYTLEAFYSVYNDGFDQNGIAKKISLLQICPSMTFSNVIDVNTRNNLHIKVNYITTNDYNDNNYLSFEIQDTLYYKNFFINGKFMGGEMISGVRDGGNTVINNKDILKTGYGVKLGYYFNANNILTVGYDVNHYSEYLSTEDGSYSVALLTYTYTF